MYHKVVKPSSLLLVRTGAHLHDGHVRQLRSCKFECCVGDHRMPKFLRMRHAGQATVCCTRQCSLWLYVALVNKLQLRVLGWQSVDVF